MRFYSFWPCGISSARQRKGGAAAVPAVRGVRAVPAAMIPVAMVAQVMPSAPMVAQAMASAPNVRVISSMKLVETKNKSGRKGDTS